MGSIPDPFHTSLPEYRGNEKPPDGFHSIISFKYLVFYFLSIEPLHNFLDVLCIILFSLHIFELPIKFIIIILDPFHTSLAYRRNEKKTML